MNCISSLNVISLKDGVDMYRALRHIEVSTSQASLHVVDHGARALSLTLRL